MAAFDASLLSSPGARALSELVTDLASEWTARACTRDEIALAFGTVHRIVVLALAKMATAWNMKHDLVRQLPPELQEQCLSPLSVAEKCRLFLVCSHWRSSIAHLPGIWNRLNICGSTRGLNGLLARSGQLPLALDVSTEWHTIGLDNCLRAHAHRIESLKIIISTNMPGEDGSIMLRHPLPLLKELSVKNRLGRAFTLSHISHQWIPRIRKLSLCYVQLPRRGVVFGRITALTIECSPSGLLHLHQTFPALRHLRIEQCSGINLPKLPTNAPLRSLEIYNSFILIQEIVEEGYARLEQLTYWSHRPYHIVTALGLLPEHPSAVHERGDYETSLILRPDEHRTLRFVICPGGRSVLQRLLCEHEGIFVRLGRLVLPASYRLGTRDEPQTALEADSVADLPALRTLAIECSARRQSVPLFDCVHGTIRAPALERIEVLVVASAYGLDVEPVDAGRLATCIIDSLICEDRHAFELFVDTAHGAQLDGDVAALRACVGKLLV